MKICKCACHIKSPNVIMHSMDIPCGCCINRGWEYLDKDKNILPHMIDKLVDKSISDWHKYRENNYIEFYRNK